MVMKFNCNFDWQNFFRKAKMIKIACMLHVSLIPCERGFSTQNRIKSEIHITAQLLSPIAFGESWKLNLVSINFLFFQKKKKSILLLVPYNIYKLIIFENEFKKFPINNFI